MTLEKALREKGTTVEEVKKAYKDLMENRGRYWLSDAYRLYRSTHKSSKIIKENFFLVCAEVLTGKFEETQGKAEFIENSKLAKKLVKHVTGREFPEKPMYPDKDEFIKILSKYRPVFKTAIKEKVLYDIDRISWNLSQVHLRRKKEEIKNMKIGLRIYDFIKDKKKVSERQLLRKFSNLRSRGLFPYLYFLNRGGAIDWNIERRSIRYIDNPAVDKHMSELKKRVRDVEMRVGWVIEPIYRPELKTKKATY